MATDADPSTLYDHGSALVWNGNMLPGAWLVDRAMDEAFRRLDRHPVVTVAIKRSHHVGCHAVFVRRAAERGAIMLLMDTNPGLRVVAPFGAIEGGYSPTPISAAMPTETEPIVVDFSLASTSLSRATVAHRHGEKLAGHWLIDRTGTPTDDPSVLFREPPGSILPLGGADLGYKGFGLALIVYALSAGLAGHGAGDSIDGNDSAVFVQLIDPDRFAGRQALKSAMSSFAAMCRQRVVARDATGVHIPGERLGEIRASSLEHGVELTPDCVSMLGDWARRLGAEIALG
jgi:L-lactate dehydrogenase